MADENLASLVPVVYYDLIARVAAGAPFVVVGLIYTGWQPYTSTTSGWLIALFVFGGGYLVGTLLSTVNLLFALIWWPILAWKKAHFKLRSACPPAAFREAYRRMDRIHKSRNSEGGVLVKMEAGAALAESLASGTVVLLFLLQIPVSTTLLLLLVLLVATAILRRWLFLERLQSFADLLSATEAHPE